MNAALRAAEAAAASVASAVPDVSGDVLDPASRDAASSPPVAAVAARLQALEAEVSHLRAELEALRSVPPPLPENKSLPRIFAEKESAEERLADAVGRLETALLARAAEQRGWLWAVGGGGATLAIVALTVLGILHLVGPVHVLVGELAAQPPQLLTPEQQTRSRAEALGAAASSVFDDFQKSEMPTR